MTNKKQSSVIQIRNWIRTNGDMSADGKTIAYSCKELDALLEQAHYMHKEELREAYHQFLMSSTNFEQYYNETYGE